MRTYYPTLTIAGSDSSGGAGIQADIKTMSAIGCYAMSAITSVTAQNTTGVRSIMPVSPGVMTDQIDMVMTDIPPLAVKIGMLCNAEVAAALGQTAFKTFVDSITRGIDVIVKELKHKVVAGVSDGEVFGKHLEESLVFSFFRGSVELKEVLERLQLHLQKVGIRERIFNRREIYAGFC